jgi:cation diffusion facilitator CzcD-associated flavoprotein CzcO
MPADWAEHPRHELVWQYLRDYARHFELYRHISFGRSIKRIEPTGDAGWRVELDDGLCQDYRGVVIANGHNWDPRLPDYDGSFAGEAIHSSRYTSPEVCRGRRVLVVGGGNSGFDIAVDVSSHAAATFHSMRRHYHVLPRYFRGVPVDERADWALRWRVPLWMRRLRAKQGRQDAWGETVAATLPRPDHRLFETHPVINSRWPYAVSQGAICVKPDVARLDGERVVFVDESCENVDMIIYATGYKITIPFIDRTLLNWHEDKPELYLNVFHPERDDLFVAGLIQPDSGQFGLVDYQSQLIAAYIKGLEQGTSAANRFQREKAQASADVSGGINYVRTPRHAIEVEHYTYRRTLQKKIAALKRG